MALPPYVAARLKKAQEAYAAAQAKAAEAASAGGAAVGTDSDESEDEADASTDAAMMPQVGAAGGGPGGMPQQAGAPARQEPPEGFKEWCYVYPCYIDPTFPLRKGRKISKEKCAGCDRLQIRELVGAIYRIGLAFEVGIEQGKRHPCDPLRPGRIRVKLFDDDKKPVHEEIPTRKALFERLAKIIGGIEGRGPAVEKGYAASMAQLDDVLTKGSMAVQKELQQQHMQMQQQQMAAQRMAMNSGGAGGGALPAGAGAAAGGSAAGAGAGATEAAAGSAGTKPAATGTSSKKRRRRRRK